MLPGLLWVQYSVYKGCNFAFTLVRDSLIKLQSELPPDDLEQEKAIQNKPIKDSDE